MATHKSLQEIGYEVIEDIQRILSKQIKCYDENLHMLALQRLKLVESCEGNTAIREAIEACLVDILSCDNASWDTPYEAFNQDLARLTSLLKE